MKIFSNLSANFKQFNPIATLSLKVKATFLGIVIGFIPVILVGSFIYVFAAKSVDDRIRNFKITEALSMLEEAEKFMLERFNNINALANLSILTDGNIRNAISNNQKEEKLTDYLKLYRVYDNIVFIDLAGNNILISEGKTIENHQEKDYFQEVIKTENTFISQPRIDPIISKKVIYFSAPVRDEESDDLLGVVVSRMPVEHIDALLTEYGANDSTYHLVDRSGIVFVTNDLEGLDAPAEEHLSRFNELRQAKKPDFFRDYEEVEQRKVLGGYASFDFTEGDIEIGWDGFLVTAEAVAYADLKELFRTIVLSTFITALATGAIAAAIAIRAIEPITIAAAAVEKIGKGDLDTRVSVSGADELAALGSNINSMAERTQLLLQEVKEKADQLQLQNENIATERDILQEDIGYILDLVCGLESGDLTIQAKVNERITGLIADTLNRAIEKLASTIAIVISTAREVTQKAEQLEKSAVTNAEQVQQQTSLLNQVKDLTIDVNNLSQNAADRAVIADKAIEQVDRAVKQGQQQLDDMSAQISTLQEGTEQIVRRTDTLRDFIELAARFTKDQKILAAQTRVLALNSSMLASRASRQQDPEQFASVTKELETLAKQVNDLAAQTNQNLIVLQQRSDSIQTVGSGLDRDVHDITELVKEFTQGVNSSRQAFVEIDLATYKVANVGKQVTQSSLDIARAAQITLNTVSEITSVAAQTEQRISLTRSESSNMEQIANNLLELIYFFKIADRVDRPLKQDIPAKQPTSPQPHSNRELTDKLRN